MGNIRFGLSDPSHPAWTSFIEGNENSSIFHHPEWLRCLSDAYGYRARIVGLWESERIVAGFPVTFISSPLTGRRWVGVPFSDHCTPLCGSESLSELLVSGAKALVSSGRAPQIEVRGMFPGDPLDFDASPTTAVLHTLNLADDPGVVFSTFKKTRVQQCVERAYRQGARIRHETSYPALRTFYRLHVETRRRHGVPVQPLRYFNLLWKHLIRRGLGFVVTAYHAGSPVASSIFLVWNRKVIYKYSASDHRAWKLSPNHAVLWHAIEWGCLNGQALFDFGRTDVENGGLRAFKSGWGTVESDLRYTYVGGQKGATSGLGSSLSGLLRRLPSVAVRSVGELLYEHVG